jgi:two-component system NtrC family sensor kinase
MAADVPALVSTVPERCRVCYTCVRECPAKAIRIDRGQAQVIHERCIGCGHCVSVCSQDAKQVLRCTDRVRRMLERDTPVAVVLAPSFPAEFTDMSDLELVGRLRARGFATVSEVASGADWVAAAYRELMEARPEERFIATTCPAVTHYVRQFLPEAVPALAPIVSPMVASARALRQEHEGRLRVIFAGPCIAKKAEAMEPELRGELDCAVTFSELRELLDDLPADLEVEPSEFDPPHAGLGALFPIARGLMQAAGISEDILEGRVVATDGNHEFVEALQAFAHDGLDVSLLEVLCCSGCIMGPGYTCDASRFQRLNAVVSSARRAFERRGGRPPVPRAAPPALDLARSFSPKDRREPPPSVEEIGSILRGMGKNEAADELDCGACGYPTCRAHAEAIHKGLAEREMCLPHTIDKLKSAVQDLALSNEELASTQQALMHSERLASMGQLAAGIAHEVNNPLGVVLLYAHLLLEQVPEGSAYREDLVMIVEQTDRCRRIVSGLLDFSRQNKGTVEAVDLREVVDRGMKVLQPPAGVTVHVEHLAGEPELEADADQLMQVLTNLVSNAYGAMPGGGVLTVHTDKDELDVFLKVTDTGTGIQPEHRKNLFEPFFTTKPPGRGTGLGLAVTYGIVKMHRGDISFHTRHDPAEGPTGTTFTVRFPRRSDPRDVAG